MVTPALLLLEFALADATTTAATTPTTPSSRTGDLRKTFVTAHSFTLVFVRRMAPCRVSRRLTAHRAAAMPVHSVKISDSVAAVKCEALLPKSNLTFSLRGGGVYEGLYEFANDLDEVYRRLAYDLDAFWDANDLVVAQLLRWFKLSALGVAAEIVLLTAAVGDTFFRA